MASISQGNSQDIQFSAAQLPVQVTGMQAMASKMWVSFIAMGFMIVMAAFIYGLVALEQVAFEHHADDILVASNALL